MKTLMLHSRPFKSIRESLGEGGKGTERPTDGGCEGPRKVARRIHRVTKSVNKIEKPERTKTVELSYISEIDPVILARAIRGKIYTSDIVLGYIIANPDGIDINTLKKKEQYDACWAKYFHKLFSAILII